jgi:hypothetical protein
MAPVDPRAFIVGCPWSGTSLLATLLDRHPQVAVPPETFFFRDLLPGIRAHGRAPSAEQLLQRAGRHPVFRDLGITATAVAAAMDAADPNGERALLRGMLAAYAASRGKQLAVEKSPVHLFYTPLILEWYPKTRIVCLLRDGRDVALSLTRVPWGGRSLRWHCAEWNSYCRSARAYAHRFADRFLLVRFEDLVAEPERILAGVDRFLDLPFAPRQLDPAVETGSILDAERPWKEKARSRADPERAGAWKVTATPGQRRIMQAAMGPLLVASGYEPDAEIRTRWLAPLDAAAALGYDALFAFRQQCYRPAVHAAARRFIRRL